MMLRRRQPVGRPPRVIIPHSVAFFQLGRYCLNIILHLSLCCCNIELITHLLVDFSHQPLHFSNEVIDTLKMFGSSRWVPQDNVKKCVHLPSEHKAVGRVASHLVY